MNWLGTKKNENKSESNLSQITLTRALVELKTLDKRIQKTISDTVFCSVTGELRKPDSRALNAQSNYDRVRDLLNRRVKLKSAIVISNANTKIQVCGMNLTVAEAIELKTSIKNYKNLLTQMKNQHSSSVNQVENLNQTTRSNLENSLSRNNGSNDPNHQVDNVSDYSRQYMKVHGVELFDPLKLSEKIDDLSKFIGDFEDEVDFVLSEKNATTSINM